MLAGAGIAVGAVGAVDAVHEVKEEDRSTGADEALKGKPRRATRRLNWRSISTSTRGKRNQRSVGSAERPKRWA